VSDDAVELRDQVGALRRRWRTVAVTVAVALGIALLVSFFQTPLYVASTEVQLGPPDAETSLTAEQVATETSEVTSSDSLVQVIDDLGLQESDDELRESVTVEPDDSGAAVLTISASRTDSDEAAAIANEVAETYLEMSESRDLERAVVIDEQIDQANIRIAKIRGQITNSAATGLQLTRLRSELEQKQSEREFLADARANIAISDAGGMVLDPADPPSSPSSPKPLRTAGLAAVIGLLLGVGFAYLRDYFDDVVRDERGLRSSVPGLPVLGRIPHWRRSTTQPATLRAPNDRSTEAYRTMGVNVRTLLDGWQTDRPAGKGRDDGGRVLLVTSATQAEGKTSTAVNLAVVASQAGLRVVLVDAHIRSPAVGEVLKLNGEPGLTDLLADSATVRQSLVGVGLEKLLVLPSGNGTSPTAPELLAMPQRARLMEHLSTEADLVVIDSAAVLGVADALEVAKDADLTVLAVRVGVSRGRQMTAALQRLEQVGAKVAGIVVTDVSRHGA